MGSIYTAFISKDDMPVIKYAVVIINKDSEAKFILSTSNDPDNVLDGCITTIEAKHVFIATMVTGNWDQLIKKHRKFASKKLPDPLSCKPGYRISESAFWPDFSDQEGLIGFAADQQADSIADVAFTKLMYTVNKSHAKKHADLLKSEKAQHVLIDDDEMDIDAQAVSDTASGRGDPSTVLIPAAWSVKSDFRLSRDWPHWPSAGELAGSEVSNVQQAQYGMMADNMFEHIKVEIAATKVKKAKKITGPVDVNAANLAADEGAQTVYFDMLERHELEDGTIVKRAGNKNNAEFAEAFRAFVVAHAAGQPEELEYTDKAGTDQRLDQVLLQLEDSALEQFYPRAGRAYARYLADRDDGAGSTRSVSVDAPSLADDVSIIDSDDDDEPQQSAVVGSKRGRAVLDDDEDEDYADDGPSTKARKTIAPITRRSGRSSGKAT